MTFDLPSAKFRAAQASLRAKLEEVKEAADERDWFLLAALASEGALGWSTLRGLGVEVARLDRWRRESIVVENGEVRPLSIVRDGPTEPGFSIPSNLAQLVLREAQRRAVLGPASLATEELLGARSTSSLSRRLQAGSLIFRPGEQWSVDPRVREALCASVLEPFDSKWFEETWGARAPRVAEVLLSTCLLTLRPCHDLYEWAMKRQEREPDTTLAPLLVSYGLHLLEFERVEPLLDTMEMRARTDLRTAAQFLRGDTGLARRLLERDLQQSPKKFPQSHPLSPLLALLFATDEKLTESDGRSPVDWLKEGRGGEASRAQRHALRTFLRYRDEPEERLRRLDPHQLPAGAPAWQILLLGLSTYAFVDGGPTRAAWAERLSRFGARALDQGFLWMGRQGLVLAAVLDRVQMNTTLSELGDAVRLPISEEGLTPQPGDLARLVRVRAPWEVKLAALERVSKMEETPKTRHRVRWYVDATSGSVHQPGLLAFDEKRGWVLERRHPWPELLQVEDIDEVDQRILMVTSRDTEDDAFPHLEVLERLVGHPRVVDGAQGELPLEVTRQHLRIETIDEVDHLRIGVRPKNLSPGLNLLRLADDRLCVVTVEASMAAVLETLREDLLVPHVEAAQVLSVLSRLSSRVPVKSPHLDGETDVSAGSTLTLRLTPHSGAYLLEMGLRPFGKEGRFFPPGSGPAVLSTTVEGRRVRTTRALDVEREQADEFVATCRTLLKGEREDTPGHTGPSYAWILGEGGVLDLLGELREKGLDVAVEWPEKSGLRLAGSATVGALRGALRSKKGWYLLSGSVRIDDVSALTLAELSRAPFVHGGRYLRLNNGDYLSVDRRVRRLGSLISGAKIDPAGRLRLAPARLFALRATLEGAELVVDEETERRWNELEKTWHEAPKIADELEGVLRPYQKEGVTWMQRLSESGFGALLADDMGLGKTLQVIAFFSGRPQGSRHLVIAPLSVCTNWQRELLRFSPRSTVRQFSSRWDPSAEPPDVTIVSFSQLGAAHQQLSRVSWDTIVVDEAQFIKNPKTQRAQAILPLSSQCRIATTGTPVENHLGDLWGIFRFLNPELLGKWSAFHTHFIKPIERDGDAEQRESLREIVRPFILRRTKAGVLSELPPLTRIRKAVHLTEDEEKRYALLRRQIHERLRTVAGRQNYKLEILAEITRLRRFCCHPRLVFPDAPDDSPKLRALVDLVRELAENGHQALVFSQYVDFLTSVRERLAEHQLPYVYLDGGSSQSDRQRNIDRFNSGEVPIFVISLKAGGVGLNLTAADYVIHLDPWWNPAVTSQATDRAHRIGQEKPVTSYELFTKDTIEEDILELHESKRELARLIEESAPSGGRGSPQELREWLETSLGRRLSSGLGL